MEITNISEFLDGTVKFQVVSPLNFKTDKKKLMLFIYHKTTDFAMSFFVQPLPQ